MAKKADVCAREVLDVVPSVMRTIRTEMRMHRDPDLSIPQFRSLLFVDRRSGTTLTGVAEHLGLTAPSTSKLIDGLLKRGMVTRRQAPADRRCVTLEITPDGARALAHVRREAQKSLSLLLGSLGDEELSTLIQAMSALRRVFATGTHGNS
jgi:MarR family transcriptional regulator for hemolysin